MLSHIVHLTLRCMLNPDANFEKQRRLIAYASILQLACVVNEFNEARCTTYRNEPMKDNDGICERDRLESVLKYALRTQRGN